MNNINERINKIKKNLEGLPRIYWINLDSSRDRYIYMSSLLNTYKIDNIRIKGIDGRRGDHKLILEGEVNKESGTDTEHGCTLSHIMCMLEFYLSGQERCIIAEDDLSFETVEYWNFTWEQFERMLPKDYGIVQLSRNTTDHRRELYRGFTRSTLCYLVRREYVETLFKNLYKDKTNKIDLRGYKNITADNFLYTFGVSYSYPLFIFHLYKSTISDNMDTIMRLIYNYNINLWRPKTIKEINENKLNQTTAQKIKEIYKKKY